MMNQSFSLSRIVLGLAFAFGASSVSAAKTDYVTIGTGGVTGIYYPTGGAIAKVVNKLKRKLKIRASVESTPGSVYNVNAVMSGDLEFGIVQSDRQYQAWNGLAEWKTKGKQTKLRSICSFHPEVITLVASVRSGIKKLSDIKGKTVNIGNPGSGQRGNAIDVLSAAGINWKKDFRAESLKPSEAPKMLQDGRIDAFFYTVGHPSAAITEATSGKTKVYFVPLQGMNQLIKKFPYYSTASIPARSYPQATNKTDTRSIGVTATFVTRSDISDHIVYSITKTLFENLETFKKLHPAFKVLNKKQMLKGLSAPLHPGAEKYYKEAGLL